MEDKLVTSIIYVLLVLLVIVCAYPVYFVLIASISNANVVNSGKLLLFPEGFHLQGYTYVIGDSRLLRGYANTIFYTVCGTLAGLAITIPAGYVLSRKDLVGNAIIMKLLVFTMYFSGGLVPTFLVVKALNLVNTRSIVIILGSVSVYNIILIRSFCKSNIPDEMLEAAQIDGCNNTQFFFQMVLPLSKAIIAVLALWYGVAHWNAYFNAFLYLRESDKYPLQIFLKEILVQSERMGGADMVEQSTIYETLKYSVIVISTAPLFCVYPFVQKYFQEGVMVGGVKG